MISIIKRFIILTLPLITIITSIVLIKNINVGSLIIYNSKDAIVEISNEKYDITNNKYTIKLWPGNYSVKVKKTGYTDYIKKVEMIRGQESFIDPLFEYIPVLEKNYEKAPYLVPERFKRMDNDSNYLYSDNQFMLLGENIEPRIFQNLPDNIFYILYNLDGSKALIVSYNEDIKSNDLYYFDTTSEELKIITNGNFSGIDWSQNGDKFTYFEPSKSNGDLIIFDTSNMEKHTLTQLYDITKIRAKFALYDEHIIILPLNNQSDLIDYNINEDRKQKITFSNDITDFKVSTKSTELFFTSRNAQNVQFFNLTSRELYKTPIEIDNLAKIEFLNPLNKIIYAQTENGLFDNDIKNSKLTKDILATLPSYEKFYYFDLKLWEEIELEINKVKIEPISIFLKTKDYSILQIQANTGTYYDLKIQN